jgi:triosephosphate isomerase
MPKRIIVGNWKMNLNLTESIKLAEGIKKFIVKLNLPDDIDVVICPPSISLFPVVNAIVGSPISLGAQNMHYEKYGAFTGEISGEMLTSVGCEYVILGHSERRGLFGEDDAFINSKVLSAIQNGLTPILCVGESLEERNAMHHQQIIRQQLELGLSGVKNEDLENIVIAYEPIWAIGTGRNASPDQTEEIHKLIRDVLTTLYGNDASEIPILYGGSMKPDNARDILAQPNVNGGLIGAASLKAEPFIEVVRFLLG